MTLGTTGAVAVNDQLRTSDPDIYAGGDRVEFAHLLTGQKVFVPLGSYRTWKTANAPVGG